MKELSIEEKAARYDRSLERARDVHTYYCDDREQLRKIEHIFPELAESEDEVMRKKLLELIAKHCGKTCEMYLWFEKQGEQNPISLEDAAKLFLEKLSESPYNNKPITDAQVITKELINFLKDTNTYNPNAINEQKPAEWSEEDINMFGSILSTLGICANNPQIPADVRSIHKKEESWFNELYYRAQPQQQEWSDEDEDNIFNIVGALDVLIKREIEKEHNGDRNASPKYYSDLQDWLKSLRPQSQWKPTEEQLRELENVFSPDTDSWDEDILRELYEQLKQL